MHIAIIILCVVIVILVGAVILAVSSAKKSQAQYRDLNQKRTDEVIKLKAQEIEISLKQLRDAQQDARAALEETQAAFAQSNVRLTNEYNQKKQHLDELIKEKQKTIDLVSKEIDSKKAMIESNLEDQTNSYKEILMERLRTQYEAQKVQYQNDFESVANELQESMTREVDAYTEVNLEVLHDVIEQIKQYKAEREAINQQIMRDRALAEQQDFYRICISDADHEDIKVLRDIRSRLHKTAFLDKIIYDTYLSKYIKEMCKRVLEGRDPSGVYKITNIETKEIYIGQSVKIATRWTNHCKAAVGLDGVADSMFQRALTKYGIDHFTWELLEEVPKDKLSEREKFYISFYDTTKYGYNQRVG